MPHGVFGLSVDRVPPVPAGLFIASSKPALVISGFVPAVTDVRTQRSIARTNAPQRPSLDATCGELSVKILANLLAVDGCQARIR